MGCRKQRILVFAAALLLSFAISSGTICRCGKGERDDAGKRNRKGGADPGRRAAG